MRRLIPAILLTLAASWAVAQEPAAGAPAADETKVMTAVVVAADPIVKTITVKKEMGPGQTGTQPETTISVDEKAIAKLKTVRAGEKVKLVLKTDPTTKRESVASIENPAPPEPR